MIIRFYLVCGSYHELRVDPAVWPKFIDALGDDWMGTTLCTLKFGINFRHVTHYEIIKPKKKWWSLCE